VRWRLAVAGTASAAAAGRVFVDTPHDLRIFDLASGRRVGTHPQLFTSIRLI
jgi:hypothetical protein